MNKLFEKIFKKQRENGNSQKGLKHKLYALAMLLGLGGTAAIAKLPSGDDNPVKDNATEISTDINVANEKDTTEHEDFVKEIQNIAVTNESYEEKLEDFKNEDIIKSVISEYNKQTGEDLTIEDVKYLKSTPQYLWVDNDGKYTFNNKKTFNEGDQTIETSDTTKIYNIINIKDNKIIASEGKVSGRYVSVHTDFAIDASGNEYYSAPNQVDMAGFYDKEEYAEKIANAIDSKIENKTKSYER